MLKRMRQRRALRQRAEGLTRAVTQASRARSLYGPGRFPDALEGRLEAMMAYMALALLRLRADTDEAALAQAFIDQAFSLLDAGLREAGVGDLSVPKRMHTIAGQFYGRLQTYAPALAARDQGALSQALLRNIPASAETGFGEALARHLISIATLQATLSVDALAAPESWGDRVDAALGAPAHAD